MNVEMLKKSGRIIYEFVSGSHMYSLNTPQSDIDIRGCFYKTSKELLSLRPQSPDPVSDEKNDISYYSIGRYFELAKDCNPNIVEFLWVPDECIRFKNSIMDKIISNRHLFISKKAKHTFSGYAFSQLGKAKGENKWINNPKPVEKPQKEDFCWFINKYNGYGEMPLRPVHLSKVSKVLVDLKKCRCSSLEHSQNMFRLYTYADVYDTGDVKGVFRDGQLACDSIPMNEEWRCLGILVYNEQEYEKAIKDHKNYWDWKKNRNEARWISQEKGEISFDAKNMMHCCRILISGINILKNGEPIIKCTGELQKFLMDIRNAKYEYEYIMKFADERMLELDELYKTSTIPNQSDINKIDDLYMEILEEISKKGEKI